MTNNASPAGEKRVIKFRVWDDEAKMFLLGFEWPIGHSGLWLEMETGNVVHLESDGDNGIDQDYDRLKDVVIQQFTGLLDKNGKEIYEGDKIEIHWWDGESTMEVISYSEKFGYFMYGNNPICELIDSPESPFEIIGNIYENKNLLTPQTPPNEQ